MDRGRKQPLYRRVNTRTHGVRDHDRGGEFRHTRNAKNPEHDFVTQASMGAETNRGVDYTPLYRFLLSRVGRPWEETYREAVSRLDRPEPVFWMVAKQREDARDVVRTGHSSYFSGLYVGDDGLLHRTDPSLDEHSLAPDCRCCTHTFNGVRFTRPCPDDVP
ncbi:hypothetical protein DWG18_11845 [Lysobacter sp. TY2-98]|uniref:hypothetical protein n=1 Tax=Lysobacter sp. TY2-98 TaxID=2290922 RepID=UPI000E20BFEC|nr:hypothetical protein [Lysobacter sp. TY2-98]AXK72899.1 hypothetical protein DWG18_11845 [Lysobacter sp. TY2-98]